MSGLAVGPVDAATPNASISVSVKVQTSCLVSATATAFRTYTAAVDAASTVSVVCSRFCPVQHQAQSSVAARSHSGHAGDDRFCVALLGHLLSSNPRGIVNRRQALGEDTAAASGAGFAPAGANADTVTVVVTY